MGDLIRAENRKRRRDRSCCHPFRFRTEWLTPWGGPVSARMEPTITFTDTDLVRFGRRASALRGVVYQVQVCGDQEYTCRSASGATARPDGELSAQCWMREAKYQMPRPVSGFPEAVYAPNDTLRPGIERQFRTYGQVANNPAPPARPCWHIGLEVIVSQRGGPVAYYLGLLRSNAIEGVVRWQPVTREAINEIDEAYRRLEGDD